MVGNNDNSGIMALSIIDLLSRFKQKQKYKHTALKVSYIEIYNENIKDLLISEGMKINYNQIKTFSSEKILRTESPFQELPKSP